MAPFLAALHHRPEGKLAIHCAKAKGKESTKGKKEELEAWQQVYSGLSDQDIAEIESIALDRSRFMVQKD